MADFSISQFKQYVANWINVAGIDTNKNDVIDADNGELAKVLSKFGIEESQIGDLLEKSDASENKTRTANDKPYPEDIHKQYVEAYKTYDTMTKTQKDNIRRETMRQAMENFEVLNIIDKKCKIEEKEIQKIIDIIKSINNKDNAAVKEVITDKLLPRARGAYEEMEERIQKYDSDFGKYDVTYRSPYYIKSLVDGGVPRESSVASMCMTKDMAKILEFLSIDESSMRQIEYVKKAVELVSDVFGNINETNKTIESTAKSILDIYSQEYEMSMDALANNILRKWMPPLDGIPHEQEPDTLAIKGAPIENTFTEVVNRASATGLSDTVDEATDKDGKFEKDGKIYIRKNGVVYDLLGNKVKQ